MPYIIREEIDYKTPADIFKAFTLKDVVDYYGIEKIENYIRKKKIERLTNGNNK